MKAKLSELLKVRQRAAALGIIGDINISRQAKKRFVITFPNGEHIHFGSSDMDNYLIHKDEQRRQAFHSRWMNNPFYNNPSSPLFYSQKLLW